MERVREISVVLPKGPTIDKIVALGFLRLAGHMFRSVSFESLTGKAPVDCYGIDLPVKYGQKGASADKTSVGSAAEWEARQWKLLEHPGATEMVGIINSNNRNGELKALPFSLARLVREVWVIGRLRDNGFDDLLRAAGLEVETVKTYDHATMINRFVGIVDVALNVAANPDPKREKKGRELIKKNFPTLMSCGFRPFTLAWHLANMYTAGQHGRTVVAEGRFWLSVFEAAKDNHAQEGEAVVATTEGFDLSRGWRGLVMATENRRVVGDAFNKRTGVAVIISQNADGNVGILTFEAAQVDLSRVARELEKIEPGLWHFETRYKSDMVLNGSESRGRPATKIEMKKIIEIVKKYAILRGPSLQVKTSPPYVDGDRVMGEVLWWDNRDGCGNIALTGTEKPVRVERSALTRGLRFLADGRRVEFNLVWDEAYKGWYARGVRLLFEAPPIEDEPKPTPAPTPTPPAEPKPDLTAKRPFRAKKPVREFVPPKSPPVPAEPAPIAPAPPPTVTFEGFSKAFFDAGGASEILKVATAAGLDPSVVTALLQLVQSRQEDKSAPAATPVVTEPTTPAVPPLAAPEPTAPALAAPAPPPPTVTVEGKVVSWSVSAKFGFVEARGKRIRVEAADLTRLVGRRTSVLLVGRTVNVTIERATHSVVKIEYLQ